MFYFIITIFIYSTEKPLHPTGINLQAEISLTTDKNLKFKSLSGYSNLIQEVVSSQKSSPGDTEDSGEDDIDIISTGKRD